MSVTNPAYVVENGTMEMGNEIYHEECVDDRKGNDDGMCSTIKTTLKGNVLMILTLVGVALGFAIGFGIRPLNPSTDALLWIGKSCIMAFTIGFGI